MRVVAVDWSVDKKHGHLRTWSAEVVGGKVERLENGRSYEQVVRHLIDLGSQDPNIVAGLDFAFSMPKWFVEEEGATSAPEFWTIVEEKGEAWLSSCPLPFWGRKNTTTPEGVELLRRTEREIKEGRGTSPSSVFLIAGGRQVGTGSIRGMPQLARMREAGWHIWPFDPPELPLLIEIFPRLFMGQVVKKAPGACFAFLETRFPELDWHTARLAASNDNAFDATVSALVMSEHVDAFRTLGWPVDSIDALEGRIWNVPKPLTTIVTS